MRTCAARKSTLQLVIRVCAATHSRFTCPETAVLFLLTRVKIKAFSQLKAFISASVSKKKNCSKRTAISVHVIRLTVYTEETFTIPTQTFETAIGSLTDIVLCDIIKRLV